MASTDARPVPLKNTAFRLYAPILDADGDPVSGASSFDSEVSLDGASFSDCTNEATEIGSSGIYYLDLTSSEMNADAVIVQIKTATSGAKTTVCVLYPEEAGDINVDVTAFGGTAGTFSSGRPEVNTTHWKGTAAATVDAAGYPVVTIKDGTGQGELATTSGAVDTVTTLTNAPSDSSGVTTLLSRLTFTRAGYLDNLSAGAVATASALSGVASNVTTLLSRITSSLFSGITSMAQWLGLLAGKQTGNSTARTEIRATGAGSGTYDETTDSQEALRDRGDAAWATATGFSTLDAAGVRSAVGLASANLDTQLAALPTAAENADAVYDEAMSGHTTAGTFGDRLRAHLTGYLQATVAGTPSTTSIPLNGSTGIDGGAPNSNNDFYNGRVIIFISGNAAGQATDITDYDGASTTLTVTALAIAPAAADKAIIV